ncbi:flagellar protein FlaG [Halalkalibacillus sediminis]|nr:flagellar protein FlaG [Halalkalibacillus sediminis]
MALFVCLVLVLGACGNSETQSAQEQAPEITEEEVEKIVLNHLTENLNKNKDEVTIKSVHNDSGKYVVKWEVDEVCEFGTIHVDAQNGEILEAEETVC